MNINVWDNEHFHWNFGEKTPENKTNIVLFNFCKGPRLYIGVYTVYTFIGLYRAIENHQIDSSSLLHKVPIPPLHSEDTKE